MTDNHASATFTSIADLIEGIQGARALGMRKFTVSTVYEPPFTSDTGRIPERVEYHFTADVIDRRPGQAADRNAA